jgi:hypothetical protein
LHVSNDFLSPDIAASGPIIAQDRRQENTLRCDINILFPLEQTTKTNLSSYFAAGYIVHIKARTQKTVGTWA